MAAPASSPTSCGFRARDEDSAAGLRLGALPEMLELVAFAETLAADVPFAVAKRVELGRALIGAPKPLLLDEPASGLNHAEVAGLQGLLRSVRTQLAVSIVPVEHQMNLVMGVSDRVAALEPGRKIADGTPQPGLVKAEDTHLHAEHITGLGGLP